MTVQEYIQSKLIQLQHPFELPKPQTQDELKAAILKLLLSKKFRKYSASDELIEKLKTAIDLNVANNDPINVTFLHGAYKLWRLEEAPEADWAELFALMHYTNWLKPICEIYEPGVWFDLFVDDLIVPHLQTASSEDVKKYLDSYRSIIAFLEPYQPKNFKMTVTTVGSRFTSPQAFEDSLKESIRLKQQELPHGLPVLTDQDIARSELNTNASDEQRKDPHWREKVVLIEAAYSRTKAEPGYHKVDNKILAFTSSIPNVAISVGSTKDSIAKYWVGVGVLKPKGDSFRQIVLSPKQLKATNYEWQAVDFGLTGKNFKKIRVAT